MWLPFSVKKGRPKKRTHEGRLSGLGQVIKQALPSLIYTNIDKLGDIVNTIYILV